MFARHRLKPANRAHPLDRPLDRPTATAGILAANVTAAEVDLHFVSS